MTKLDLEAMSLGKEFRSVAELCENIDALVARVRELEAENDKLKKLAMGELQSIRDHVEEYCNCDKIDGMNSPLLCGHKPTCDAIWIACGLDKLAALRGETQEKTDGRTHESTAE